jgi:hypothetical protein
LWSLNKCLWHGELLFVLFCDIVQIKKALCGLKVEVTHCGTMRQMYCITNITKQPIKELQYAYSLCYNDVFCCRFVVLLGIAFELWTRKSLCNNIPFTFVCKFPVDDKGTMKCVVNYGCLSPLLFMMKMMVWYFVSKFIKVMTIVILVEISLFFIDTNSEVWFLLYRYLDGVIAKHNWE